MSPGMRSNRVAALCASTFMLIGAGVASGSTDPEATVARMAQIGSCSSPSFSPDGRRVAFVSDMTGVPQVWTVPVEGGWPTLVTPLRDQIGSVDWSPREDWLAFTMAPGGGMNQQIFLIRPDGTGMKRLTDGGRDNNWMGRWTDDGKALTLASSREDPGAMHAYLFDMEAGTLRLAARNPGIGYLTGVDRGGARGVLWRMKSRSDSNLFLLDLRSGTENLLTSHEGPGSFGGGVFSPSGDAIYFSSNAGRDLIALARVRIDAAGRPGPAEVIASRDDAELQEFDLSPDGTVAALVWNVAGRSELEFMDLTSSTRRSGPSLPAEIASDLTFSPDGTKMALTLRGATRPPDIWILERGTGALRQLTRSPHPGVDLDALVAPDLVRFGAHDGLELSGWLYRPSGHGGRGPVVLSFHGGPEGQERPSFRATYQALLAQGIAVFAPNVRGSAGFGKRFVNLDNGALRFDAIKDIESCVRHLVEAGVADPTRIGIMGGSYGGYMTMAGLAEYPDLFAAGANLFGVVNFETFFAHTEPWMAAISTVEYGDPETQADLLRRLSPINKVDRVRAPTIVLHGQNDTNVPVVEAEQVVENLKKRGVPVEYVLFPDEGHGFDKVPNRITSTVSIVRWFVTYLKGDVGSRPQAAAEEPSGSPKRLR